MTFEHLCLLHLLPTAYMTGLIWFVQFAHYPLLRDVGDDTFRRYQAHNLRATSWAVLPGMLPELALAACLLPVAPESRATLTWIGAALLAAIWLSTFLLQVPCHARLQRGFDERTWRRLVRSNWLRTIGWTLRVAIAVGLVW